MPRTTDTARFILVLVFATLFNGVAAVRRSGVVDQAGREAYNLLHMSIGQDDRAKHNAQHSIINTQDFAKAVDADSEPSLIRRQATATTTSDSCVAVVTSAFPTNANLFCSGWFAQQNATTAYIAPPFQAACTAVGGAASQLSSACSNLGYTSPTPTTAIPTSATPTGGMDNCVSAIQTAFAADAPLFCNGWANAGTTGYIAPPFQTACAGSSYARITSACALITSTSAAAVTTAPAAPATPTGGYDACYTVVTSAFPNNYGQFCAGWNNAGTTAYVGPAFQTSCAGNSYSRISSVCYNLTYTAPAPTTTPLSTPTGGLDNCYTAVTSAFPTNYAQFCNGWNGAGTTAFIAGPFQTSCAGNSYSRISSVCSVLTSAAVTATVTPAASSTPVGGMDNCVSAVMTAFPTNANLFCAGWQSNNNTAGYLGAAFVTSCAGNPYSRLSSACTQLGYGPAIATPTPTTSATPTGGMDNCVSAIQTAFPTNANLFCAGWQSSNNTSGFVAPAFQTSCAGNSYSRMSSACTQLGYGPATATPTPTTLATPTGGMDNCVSAIQTAFPTNANLFCAGWQSTNNTSGFVAPAFQTSCAGNSFSRMSSACTQLGYAPVTPVATTATPTGGMDNCVTAIQSAFATNTALFCAGFTSGGYIAPAFQTSCAGNSVSRISSACSQLTYTAPPVTTATPTGGMDNCVTAIQSAFATNTGLFCAGFTSGGYIAPAFQTSCAGNSVSRISSACSQLTYTAPPVTTATPTGGLDNCVTAIQTAFASNAPLFCQGFTSGGFVAPAFQTSCAGDSYSRIASACSQITYTPPVVTTATPTGGLDNCYTAISSAFGTSTALLCQGWANAGTTGYIGPAIQTACAGNSYSRISSVCTTLLTPSLNPTFVPTPTGGSDNCYSAITTAFASSATLLCQGWANAGTTGYIAPAIQSSCAGSSYQRISSVCSTILTPSLDPSYVPTTTATPTGGLDNCWTAVASAFPTNEGLFCQGWASAGTTGFIGAALQTACAGNSYSRISSVCTTILTPSLSSGYIPTPTGGSDNCVTALSALYTNSVGLYCQGFPSGGTTQFLPPALVTSCAGNSYSRISSACMTITNPALLSATSTACTSAVGAAFWPPPAGASVNGGSGILATPVPGAVSIRGPSNQNSDLRFLPDQPAAILPTLINSILNFIGVQTNLITGYPIDTTTGALALQSSQCSLLQPLLYQPILSRDAGKGGVLGDQKMFIFADTGISSPPNASGPGMFEGFVSNSVAIDVGMQGAQGNALTIQDGAGLFNSPTGGQRGFIPLTTGESAYNLKNEGNGQRYAIWPESSIIPLFGTTALFFAPIIFCNVNYATGVSAFPYVGVTAMTITPNDLSGPLVNRFNNMMWDSTFPEWGCTGGIRSWGPSGIGGNDGMVYIYAATAGGGLLLARVPVASYADRSKYSYYQGNATWGSVSPSASQASAYFTTGAFSTVDIFWSPKHSTFMLVYQSFYADNGFFWRYLQAPPGLKPVWAGGNKTDFVEAIVTYPWSSDRLLFTTPAPADGSYTYGGGVMMGYYDTDDITRGGGRMLLTWTEPTGQNPGSAASGYYHRSAEVDWS